MDLFRLTPGSTPLLISMPHAGTHIPAEIAGTMTLAALGVPDTDWHLPILYGWAAEVGAGILQATHSRYVIDLNRDPEGKPLYPGADNTELCPTSSFEREPLYRDAPPDAAAIAERRRCYWQPYHDALAAELARLKEEHGIAVLWDAHSIRSRVPRLFDGRLPDLNLGTGGGGTADLTLALRLLDIAGRNPAYTAVLNGRFTGGYITRHYGRPQDGVHAIQLEMVQATYMREEPPFAYDPDRAAAVQPVLKALIGAALDWAITRASESPDTPSYRHARACPGHPRA